MIVSFRLWCLGDDYYDGCYLCSLENKKLIFLAMYAYQNKYYLLNNLILDNLITEVIINCYDSP